MASLTRVEGSRTIDDQPIHNVRDMRVNNFVVVFAGLLLAGAAGRVRAQSLGDVAKKEEARRKQVQSSGKVYTNKDLGSAPPVTVVPPDAKTGAAASDAKAGQDAKGAADAKDSQDANSKNANSKDAKDQKDAAAKGPEDAKGQAYWAGRRKAVQEALDRDLTFADALQSRINALNADFVNRDDPAQRAVIDRDRQKAVAELERLRTQIVADRKAIADFEEEARRAGVPPGWLR
jgi:hypothetical protein